MFVLEYKDKTFIRIYQIYFEIIFLRVPLQIIRVDIVWGVIHNFPDNIGTVQRSA
jgi:hypothetical protein